MNLTIKSESTAWLSDEPLVQPRTDFQLLTDFLAGRESAFDELVRRHAGLVYSAAVRQVFDAETAGEVTNSVFIVLARKASRLGPGTVLAAWLHRTTRLAALQAIRRRARRQKYEQEAALMHSSLEQHDNNAPWEEIAPLLDEAMARLAAKDHQAVVLRFFQKKSFLDIALALGSTEEAVRKRVNRALAKLQTHIQKRGISVTDLSLADLIERSAVQPCPSSVLSQIRPMRSPDTSTQLADSILRALSLHVWLRIGLSLLAPIALAFFASSRSTSPLESLRRLNQAAQQGDAKKWAELIYVQSPEEQQARQWLSSNVVVQAELRRALLQQFGPTTYGRSAFPRLLDDLSEDDLSAARVTTSVNAAEIHLPTGSRLQFLRKDWFWHFDLFRTSRATPAQIEAQIRSRIPRIQSLTRDIQAGHLDRIESAETLWKQP
jgi:RNA polymerase sigma factor (sigma-70 family)